MDLVVFVGGEKEGIGQIKALVNRMDCEKIILVKDKSTPKPLFNSNKVSFVDVDTSISLLDLKEEMLSKLKPKLNNDFEASLSIASGSGKEHMALVAALLSVPVGIKLVAYTKKGVEFLT